VIKVAKHERAGGYTDELKSLIETTMFKGATAEAKPGMWVGVNECASKLNELKSPYYGLWTFSQDGVLVAYYFLAPPLMKGNPVEACCDPAWVHFFGNIGGPEVGNFVFKHCCETVRAAGLTRFWGLVAPDRDPVKYVQRFAVEGYTPFVAGAIFECSVVI